MKNLLVLGLLLACGVAGTSQAATSHRRVAATYTCVMHPQIHRSHPGKCPKCGMKLVPVKK